MLEALLEGEAEEPTRKVIELAKARDTHALRLCLKRLMPPGRDRLVCFDLPPLQSADDLSLGITSILQAVSEARIRHKEGEVLSRILADQATVINTQDFERRMRELEQPSVPEETTVTPIEDDPLC